MAGIRAPEHGEVVDASWQAARVGGVPVVRPRDLPAEGMSACVIHRRRKFTVHTYPELKSLVSPASRNDRPRLPLLALAVTFTPAGAWATGKPRAEVAKTAKARRDVNDFMFVLVMFLTGKE